MSTLTAADADEAFLRLAAIEVDAVALKVRLQRLGSRAVATFVREELDPLLQVLDRQVKLLTRVAALRRPPPR